MDHSRHHRSVLAGIEKRLLVGMAGRIPASINSDHLTAVALAAMLAAGPAFALISRTPWAAVAFAALLAVNWFGDSLDGTLARVRGHERPRYGYYVDHVIDLCGTAAFFVGVAASGLMSPWVAFAVLAAYLLVAAEAYLGTHAHGVFRISVAGIGPTELRILLAIGAFKVALTPWVYLVGHRLLLLDAGGVIAAIGLTMAFLASAVRSAVALYRVEPLPGRTASTEQFDVNRRSNVPSNRRIVHAASE